jgi:biotin-dependent carboxylase-like uncharacterized protein
VPVGDGPDDARHREALAAPWTAAEGATYELCGPKVQKNPEGFASHVLVRHGCEVLADAPRDWTGLRSYLGVRGGIDVAPVLGSRSYDALSGIGPAPLQPGDVIPVGRPAAAFPRVAQAAVGPIVAGRVDLTVAPGPREDWFTDPEALIRSAWVISERSDRVGVRLVGPPLQHRWPDRQLASEGVTRGAIQVPPNGQPVILGPDHPTTGGYPVIGVVIDADTDRVGQLRPGQPVRLHWNHSGNATATAPGW